MRRSGSAQRGRAGAFRRSLRLLPRELAIAIALYLFLRLLLSAYGALVAIYSDPWGPCHQELAFADWARFPRIEDGPVAFPLLGVWERWDACWYIKIASFGYQPGENATAFFPLFPGVTRVVGVLLGGSFTLAAMVVSGVAYVVAMSGLFRLVRWELGRRTALRTVLYLSVFPSAFFLFAPFTESLFLAAAVWAILGARQRQWIVAGAAALAAALTRTHGILLVLPLAWEAFAYWRSRPTSGEPWSRGWPALAAPLLAISAPPAGFLGFNTFADAVMGQTPADSQAYWGGANFHPPWEVFMASLRWTIERGDGMQLINLTMLMFAAVMLVPIFRRLPPVYGLYALPHVAVLATRILPTPLTSTSRFVLVIFPIFIILARLGRREWFHTGWLIGSALLLGFLAYLFFIGDFVA